VLPWRCCSWLVVGSNGRPPVSLGSDMFGEGGNGWYISKAEALGLTGIRGSSGGVCRRSEPKCPDVVVRKTAMS
jgi:hypothetical protein